MAECFFDSPLLLFLKQHPWQLDAHLFLLLAADDVIEHLLLSLEVIGDEVDFILKHMIAILVLMQMLLGLCSRLIEVMVLCNLPLLDAAVILHILELFVLRHHLQNRIQRVVYFIVIETGIELGTHDRDHLVMLGS